MTIEIPVYQNREPLINLTRALASCYEGWSPHDLQSEQVRHAVGHFSAREGGRDSDAAFHAHEVDLIAREIRRQQAILARHAADPRAVAWPDNREWYERLRGIAQRLKRDYSLAAFVESNVLTTSLRRVGPDHWLGACPVPTHDDKGPSFNIYDSPPDDRHFHCFGCNCHGDVFHLTAFVFGIVSFVERVRFVAAAFGNEVQL